jgi:hypothetical protein
MDINIDDVVDRYSAVWSEADPELRRRAIADLWAADGVQFVESTRFRGHKELDARHGRQHVGRLQDRSQQNQGARPGGAR